MQKSRLPEGGMNLFQKIKIKKMEAEAKGIKILNFAIGQPKGPALKSARLAAAEAVLSDEESMHEYQDNGSPGVPDFAQRFVKALVKTPIDAEKVDYLPIPGIKPMMGLIPLACDCHNWDVFDILVTTTNPGYPTPADWANSYLLLDVEEPLLSVENSFRFLVDDLVEIRQKIKLIMMNYPHNPSGQIATREWLEEICSYCVKNDIRIFNDAAYTALTHSDEHCTLAEVAINFPKLSWVEAFSASKLIGNGTGWRVGAMVGSSDFIGDIKTIKGNTDSGFVAFAAAGVLAAVENDQGSIKANKEMYAERLALLKFILMTSGMRIAVEPGAGFFTLWEVPKKAFGKKIRDGEHFNFLMIEKTGMQGVHFGPYIRYAVVGNVEAMANEVAIAFKKANVSY